MPESKTPQDLPPPLSQLRAELRASPLFRELVKSIPRRRFRPYNPAKEHGAQIEEFVYLSGAIAGQTQVVVWLLGFDPNEQDGDKNG